MITTYRDIGYLTIIIAALLCMPVLADDTAPDYSKIVRIQLDYSGYTYTVSSIDVAYGRAPNLDFRGGDLNGIILDSGGKEMRKFAIRQPGVALGDIMGPDGELAGYTESQTAGRLSITIPYLPDMQQFTLTDPRDGSVLVTADLNTPISSFCSEYSQDPECLSRITVSQLAAPDTGSATPDKSTYLALAAVLTISILIAAGIAVWTIRRRAEEADTPKQKTVLIVDDDPDIVDIINILLEKRGFATMRASNGQECLDALRKQVPDLILLDIMMEPMDGWETLEEIKKTPDHATIPVLMLTGKSLTPTEAQKYRICIHDYIMKPFRMEDLNVAIDSILERKKKLNDSITLAKKAGIGKEMFCELDMLTRHISVNRKIVGLLNIPMAVPTQADLDTLDDMLVVDYLNVTTTLKEKRVEELKNEINTAFRSKGLPEFMW